LTDKVFAEEKKFNLLKSYVEGKIQQKKSFFLDFPEFLCQELYPVLEELCLFYGSRREQGLLSFVQLLFPKFQFFFISSHMLLYGGTNI